MATNPNLTGLDLNQAMIRCIDALNDALRVQIGDAAFEISTDASEDSVANRSMFQSSDETLDQASASGELIAEMNVEGYNSFQLMATIDSAITGTGTVEIQVSPADSGDLWIPTGVTLAVTGSTNLKSNIDTSLAKRVRANLSSSNISVGSAQVYLQARG